MKWFRDHMWRRKIGMFVLDLVLIVLWVLASMTDPTYVSVTVCFALFLVNDLYGFISWHKMRARQEQNLSVSS